MGTRLLACAAGLLVLVGLSACRHDAAASSGRASEASPDFVARTDAWHAERLEKLRAPDGWLSLVALEWLDPGPNRVGRGSDAEVSYDGLPADHVGTIVVGDDGIRFEPVDGVPVEGVPADGVLHTDADGSPTVLVLGDVRFHVVVRGGRPALRMKDAAAPTRIGFEGIERYPADEAWRIVAEFVPALEGEMVGLDTVIGVRAESEAAGRARFERDGEQVDAVLLASGSGGSYLRFADATNGGETYPVGRYLYVEPSLDGETVILDFNRAYSPPCAFTAYGTCSIPPRSNTFSFDVPAGEQWSGAH